MKASFSIEKANQDNQVENSAEVKLESHENIDVVEAIPPCALALVFFEYHEQRLLLCVGEANGIEI